ncbi:hypothetical protein GOP47_0024826 [Adiantum capillus-veneris]|uniref:Fe2OG dioxygenase domain-containing protein n=1 Tax=Adiantum capillus-veneris TaxID=13818 RepID=A0A9D4U548_ADICA|nr:hypothetical protein GOP47_0024826 [Adiantum capillus-veneris]
MGAQQEAPAWQQHVSPSGEQPQAQKHGVDDAHAFANGEEDGGAPNPNGHGANPSLGIDPSFVVPPEHRPCRAPSAASSHQIPVIDLGPLTSNVTTVRESLVSQKKVEVKRSSENSLGYNDGELSKNVRDWKEVYDMAPAGSFELPANFDVDADDQNTLVHTNQWPSFMPNLRKVCEEYMAALDKLAFTLLELMAESLGLPSRRFHEDFKSSTTSLFRLNHYPICPAPELALGVSRHKDVGALTILLQGDVGGLEVRSKSGEWIVVKPNPDAFVINVGDITQVYSNDRYQSVEHRVVVNENKDRPFNWGRYLKRRLDSNYKNLGVENLQISHYSLVAYNGGRADDVLKIVL